MVVQVGTWRYLKPKQVEEMKNSPYDFAVVVHRSLSMVKSRCPFLYPSQRQSSSSSNIASKLCLVKSPLLCSSSDGEHMEIVDELCKVGLMVDILDAGYFHAEEVAKYFILLVRASEEVVEGYGLEMDRESKSRGWEHVMEKKRSKDRSRAEVVEIVDYIIQQTKSVHVENEWIHDIFPVHEDEVSKELLMKYVLAFSLSKEMQGKWIDSIRNHFGEKVAYYFSFIQFYNVALLPIAVAGLVMEGLRKNMDTVVYMRVLPMWGILVSVIWSFGFLKCWDRQAACLQYKWNRKVHVKQVEYDNKWYKRNVMSSMEEDAVYVSAEWKRMPKYVCVGIFMMLQTVVMLMCVALWVSIYEVLKVKYPDGSIFSTQWFLILLEGIVFGFFVDYVQWNVVVTRMGKLFTHWENYETEEGFEKALIRKLFIMDFLNYYTWFFSLAFIFVIPGFGNYLTGYMNALFYEDDINCCFGPFVNPSTGDCITCPTGDPLGTCIECVGWFTFDRHHVDLSAMFVTPIVVTQTLNMVAGVVIPWLVKSRQEKKRKEADQHAHAKIMKDGGRKVLGNLSYEAEREHEICNRSNAKYIKFSIADLEILNSLSRTILFESEQDGYEPYNDFHVLTIQYGFTIMFSILWPPMPAACMLINFVKMRVDSFRICKTLKRPVPRKASGIGEWRNVLWSFAFIAILVNVALICISTGAIEFYIDDCVKDIRHRYEKQGKTLADFVLGPDFGCLHFTWRLLVIMILEHLLFAVGLYILYRIPGVPGIVRKLVEARDLRFKDQLRSIVANSTKLESPKRASSGSMNTPKGTNSTLENAGQVVIDFPNSKKGASRLKKQSSLPGSAKAETTSKDELARQWSNESV